MIPKKIHYCWFGGGPKDELFEKCITSWRKYFPDWEIIEWNEKNFDVNFCRYCKKAYEMKKYAFVSDVARLKIIYDEGGIYFDTDVEVVRKFDDKILSKGYFGEEKKGIIATGLGFAANKNNDAVKAMLDGYDDLSSLVPYVLDLLHEHNLNQYDDLLLSEVEGTVPKFVFPCPLLNTAALIKAGYAVGANKTVDGVAIYSPEYFCAFDIENDIPKITNRTYSIHHYSASWKGKKFQKKKKFKKKLTRLIGSDMYLKLRKIKHMLMRSYK